MEKILSKYTRYSRAITAIIFVSLIVIIVLLYARGPKVIVQEGPSKIEQVTTIRRDANDKILYELKATLVAKKEAEVLSDSLARALKISKKNIKEVTVIHSIVDTVFRNLQPIVVNDSVFRIEQHDPWVDIVVEGNGKITGLGKIKYNSSDSLYLVQSVRNPLIGATKRTLTIRSTNPYNVIRSGYSYSIQEKKTVLAVSAYAGYGWNGQKFSPQVGIGLTKPLISFKR